MPYGDRLQILETRRRVIGSLFWIGVAVLVLHLSAEHVRTANPPDSNKIAEIQDKKTGQKDATPNPAPSARAVNEQPPAASVNQPPAEQPGYYEKRDLEAQQGMAESAEKTVEIVRAQVKIGYWQTGLLFITVFFAGWAAIAASKAATSAKDTVTLSRDMVTEAEKTTAAAFRANDAAYESVGAARAAVRVAQQSAEQQLRAYIHVVSVRREPVQTARQTDEISINFENLGQTPAYNLVVRSALEWAGGPQQATFSENNLVAASPAVAGPTGKHSNTRFISQNLPEYKNFMAGNGSLFVYGRIDYEDAFGNPRATHFRLINQYPQIGSFALCEGGNSAT